MSVFRRLPSVSELARRSVARLWLVAAAVLILHWASGLDVSPRLAGGPYVGALGIEFEEPSLRPVTSLGLSRPTAEGDASGEGKDRFDASLFDGENDHSKSLAFERAWRLGATTRLAAPIVLRDDPPLPSASRRAFNPRAPPIAVS